MHAPMPADAPVTSAVEVGDGLGMLMAASMVFQAKVSPLVPIPDRLRTNQARRWAVVVGGTSAIAGVWIASRIFLRAAGIAVRAVRFAFAAATFRLYRRCPDCRTLIRADARVCRHCGYRRS